MNPPRSDYKAVWNQLASSPEGPMPYVSGYDDEARLRHDTEVTLGKLRETVGIRPDDIFLEIGCGVGRVGQGLAPLVREWIGCDVSAEMLRHTRERLKAFGNVRTQEISGYDLRPIADASVDVVYATVVFMHLDEWDRYNYVLDAMRVLRPGGRFYCDAINLASDEGWAVFEAVRTTFPPQGRPAHISRCSTVPEIETFLRRAGYVDLRILAPVPLVWIYGGGRKP